jgi:hypothetical protein
MYINTCGHPTLVRNDDAIWYHNPMNMHLALAVRPHNAIHTIDFQPFCQAVNII